MKTVNSLSGTWLMGSTYQQIKDSFTQMDLFDDDFDDCDSGYCGL